MSHISIWSSETCLHSSLWSSELVFTRHFELEISNFPFQTHTNHINPSLNQGVYKVTLDDFKSLKLLLWTGGCPSFPTVQTCFPWQQSCPFKSGRLWSFLRRFLVFRAFPKLSRISKFIFLLNFELEINKPSKPGRP